MQFAKRLFMGLVVVAPIAMLLTLSAPKAVHALVAALVRDVDNPGRATLVVASCVAQIPSGSTGDLGCPPTYTVPAGYRMVIQQVEVTCVATSGTSLTHPVLDTTTNGVPVVHSFVLANEGTDAFSGLQRFSLNEAVSYYVDPGSGVYFTAITTDSSGRTECFFQLNGYLISYP